MGLGRTTRFAKLPAGARRVSVMRAGAAGIKALAPPVDLFEDFKREKASLVRAGVRPAEAHVDAFRRTRYRERFVGYVRAGGMVELREIVGEARECDVYVMCMCPYRTPDEACHTYLLLELARECDPALAMLPEPSPHRAT